MINQNFTEFVKKFEPALLPESLKRLSRPKMVLKIGHFILTFLKARKKLMKISNKARDGMILKNKIGKVEPRPPVYFCC